MSEIQGTFQNGLCCKSSCLDVEGRGISEEVEYHSGKSVVEREGLGVFLFGFSFAVQY